ncbi:MAG: hypothetical protein HY657_05095 [Acidobacteria bacterium]|nr:hypothetical protein [Acidobacteriota bacterium]
MSDPSSSQPAGGPPSPSVIGEVQPFDPGPSVVAAASALDSHGADFALIGGLALEAWGIARATKDADFAVPVGVAERAADTLRGPATEIRPLRIGGVGLRDNQRGLRIDLVDRRFHFAALFEDAIREARTSGRKARVAGHDVSLVSMEFLLAMKLVSGEPKDEIDVRRILQREELRYGEARGIVERHLGAASANRLDALAREAGRPEVVARLYRNGEEPE